MSYQPKLNLRETETAIKALKDFFERALSLKLRLQRVSAPLFLLPETGLNDNLNGCERPVSFDRNGLCCGNCTFPGKMEKVCPGQISV